MKLKSANEAVRQAWEKSPFTMRRALFVIGKPGGVGMHTPCPLKPVSSSWCIPNLSLLDGKASQAINMNLASRLTLFSRQPEETADRTSSQIWFFKSRTQNREIFLKLDLDVTGAFSGDYLLHLRAHDSETDKTAMIELPFTQE
jgi:hypothetical protein